MRWENFWRCTMLEIAQSSKFWVAVVGVFVLGLAVVTMGVRQDVYDSGAAVQAQQKRIERQQKDLERQGKEMLKQSRAGSTILVSHSR
jgi:hypothetical protein